MDLENESIVSSNLQTATSILNNYLIRFISAFGIIFNLFSLFILKNKRLKHNIYKFLWCRTFSNLIVCAFGCLYIHTSCIVCENSSHDYLFTLWYLFLIPLRMAFTCSAISDIVLILNRYFEILKTKNCLTRLSKKQSLGICLAISILIYLPVFFSIGIVPSTEGLWRIKTFKEENKTIAGLFLIGLSCVETVIPLTILTVLNIQSIRKFHELMENKVTLTNNRNRIYRAEAKFTKLVVSLTTISIFTRLIDMLSDLVNRLNGVEIIEFSRDAQIQIQFVKQLTFCFLFAAHALDGLVYFKMDQNLWNIVTDYYRNNYRNVSGRLICF